MTSEYVGRLFSLVSDGVNKSTCEHWECWVSVIFCEIYIIVVRETLVQAWCLIRECNYHEGAHTPRSKRAGDAATEIRVTVRVGSLFE